MNKQFMAKQAPCKRWYFCNKHSGGNEVAQANFKV